MKITSIVENTSSKGFPVEHGLSLYIQMDNGEKLLFDMGQGSLFAENAATLGLSIADVDTAVISHGHYDHGGGLKTFLEMNSKAPVYIHKDAFLAHYSLRENGLAYIGIDKDIENNQRLVKCGSVTKITDTMTLFADVQGQCCLPLGNRLLYESASCSSHSVGIVPPQITDLRNDLFTHEQNLVIEEGDNVVLFAGCAHNGIVNIIRKAQEVTGKQPTHVLAGMHLVKSGLNAEEEDSFIDHLAKELMVYNSSKSATEISTKFYTMHCTGTEQYQKLKSKMGEQVEYISCGESVTTYVDNTKSH